VPEQQQRDCEDLEEQATPVAPAAMLLGEVVMFKTATALARSW
jgi:hypothetical protein